MRITKSLHAKLLAFAVYFASTFVMLIALMIMFVKGEVYLTENNRVICFIEIVITLFALFYWFYIFDELFARE